MLCFLGGKYFEVKLGITLRYKLENNLYNVKLH